MTPPLMVIPDSGPVIRITGRVFPTCTDLSFSSGLVKALALDPATPSHLDGLTARFRFKIEKCQVEIFCHVNRIQQTDFDQIFTCAYELTRSAIDLMAFSVGRGMMLILEQAHYPDGTVAEIFHNDPSLPPLCTSYRTNQEHADGSLDLALRSVTGNRSLMFALHDLTETMESPHKIRINCARAIEAIAQMLSPGDKNAQRRWKVLGDTLNVTKDYTDPIRDESAGPRHGSYFEPPTTMEIELRKRSWKIMDRFMEYLKRRSGALPLSDFPIL